MNNQSLSVRVRHIGKHDKRADTMSGEGTVWNGEGDIKPVSRRAWEQHLSKHPDLWELVSDDATPAPAPSNQTVAVAATESGGLSDQTIATTQQVDYKSIDRADLVKMARDRNLEFDGRISKELVIDLLLADDKAKAGA